MPKTKILLYLFAVFIFSTAYSQNSIIQKTDSAGVYKLTDVVVTATKTKTNTLGLANSISIIDSAQISNSNSTNVFDVLKNEVGMSFTRQGGVGTLSNIYIRGANSSHTLVMVDGIEVNLTNDPSGVYDFSALPTDNIERIEVLRGPQSTLYGSDAMAGVVNIITKKGYGSPKVTLFTEGGSYNTYKGLAGFNGSIDKFNLSATLSRTKSDGFSNADKILGNTEKDGYKIDNFSSALGYNLSESSNINLYTRFTNSRSDYDQFGGRLGDDPTYVFNQQEFSLRAEGNLKMLDGIWDQKIGFNFLRNVRKYSYDTSSASIYFSHSLYDGRLYKLDWQNDFKIAKSNLLTAGAELKFEEASSEYYAFNYLLLPDYASIFPKKDARTLGIYLQDQFQFDKSFFSSAGIRLDNHNKFGSQLTYRIAPAYLIWESGTKFKATLGTGFKAPSLFYLFDPAYGNENLNPEKSIGWDFGVEQFLFKQYTSVGATYFYNKFTDMFGFDPITFKTININKAVTKGVEIYLQSKPADELNLKLNYTYTDAKDLSPNSQDYNTKLLRRPENKVGLYTSYSINPKTNINADVIWVGTREDIDFSTYQRVELKGYVLINLAAHYDVFDFARLNLRIENLLNTEYEEVYGYGTAGFSVYAGINLIID
jgi:vitamin B12 transporter